MANLKANDIMTASEAAAEDRKVLRKKKIKSPDVRKMIQLRTDPKTVYFFHSEEDKERFMNNKNQTHENRAK